MIELLINNSTSVFHCDGECLHKYDKWETSVNDSA